MTDKTKNTIEVTLKPMNDILFVLVKHPDKSIEYHKQMLHFLRNIGSLRDRMLESEGVDPITLKEVAALEAEATRCLFARLPVSIS